MDKFLYPTHTTCCIISGPNKRGKGFFLRILFIQIINEFVKMYIYSPSLHQGV